MPKNAEYTLQLPGGWVKLFNQRQSGASMGSWDVYLRSPDGKRVRFVRTMFNLEITFELFIFFVVVGPMFN